MAQKILLVDDHELFINGLKLMLSINPNLEVVGQCRDGYQAIEYVQDNEVDIILLDINMPKINGYETTLEIRKHDQDIKIIALTMFIEHHNITKMLEAGVNGYVHKNTNAEILFEAIDKVMHYEYHVPSESAYLLEEYLRKKKDAEKGYHKFKYHILTEREKEVLRYIINGYTNQEIADEIYLSTRTVDTHRQNIMSKLNIKNTASLVKYALENKVYLGLELE